MKLCVLLLTLALSFPIFGKTIKLTSKNSINFNQPFTASFVANKQLEAMKLCSQNVNSDIYVVLYTPGGSVSAGQLFFDTLNALPCKFHTITIFSASMGYITVQSLGTRYILPSGVLMSHRASIKGLGGEIGGELDTHYSLIKESINEIDKKVADRIKITLKDYKKLIADELWLTGEQSVKLNHADELAVVSCDESLMGTTKESVRTFFGSYDVEFSNCPIITAPINITPNKGAVPGKYLDYHNNPHKNISWEM